MWYELLPTITLLGTCVTLPHILPYYINNWLFGNPIARDIRQNWDYLMFERDVELTGVIWKLAGLENIPDK